MNQLKKGNMHYSESLFRDKSECCVDNRQIYVLKEYHHKLHVPSKEHALPHPVPPA